MTIRFQAVWALAATLLAAGCGSSSTGETTGAPAGLTEACVSAGEVEATVPYQGTVVFSVVPEGLPEGAEITTFSGCGFSAEECRPEQRPLYYVPCSAAGPTVCAPGQDYQAVCPYVRSCPAGRNPIFFLGANPDCPYGSFGGIRRHSFTVRCADGMEVERDAVLRIVLPGDCDGDGFYAEEEVGAVITAVFDSGAEQCKADLNLDGRVTPDELQRVVELATRGATTSDPCPIGEPTPTPGAE